MLRDWQFLLRNATDGMYTLRSSPDVLIEAGRTFRRRHAKANGAAVTRLVKATRVNLDEVVPDLDGATRWNGTDPHDRHVLATAVASQAKVFVTADRGFANMRSDSLQYSVYHSDDSSSLSTTACPVLPAK